MPLRAATAAIAAMSLAGLAVFAAAPAVAHVSDLVFQSGPTRVVLMPVADTYVRADRTRRNFGAKRHLKVGSKPKLRAYLRFQIPQGAVERATLRVFSQRRSKHGIRVRLV